MFSGQRSMTRELISIPLMGDNHDSSHLQKNKFDQGRLGQRRPISFANCSLKLKSIPPRLNSIALLDSYLSRFGKLMNIRVNHEGDADAAIVTFSSYLEACSAYRSIDADVNNQIKVSWYSINNDGEPRNFPSKPLQERFNYVQQYIRANPDLSVETTANQQSLVGTSKESKAGTTDFHANQAKSFKENSQMGQDEKRMDVLKLKQDLARKKQELLEKQLNQQKLLIQKMEKLPAGSQRNLAKEAIKKSQQLIEGIRKDIVCSTMAAKKALIQNNYPKLKQKSAILTGGARGRRFNPMQGQLVKKNILIQHSTITSTTNTCNTSETNRPYITSKTSTDYQQTKKLIPGYEIEEGDDVLSHFQDQNLSMAWCSNVQLDNQTNSSGLTEEIHKSESAAGNLFRTSPLGFDNVNFLGEGPCQRIIFDLREDDEDDEDDENNEDYRSWKNDNHSSH